MKDLIVSYYDIDDADEKVGALYLAVQNALGSDDLSNLDIVFETTDETRLPTIISLGLLRYSCAARTLLPHWPEFRDRCRAEYVRRQLDEHELLQGLFG